MIEDNEYRQFSSMESEIFDEFLIDYDVCVCNLNLLFFAIVVPLRPICTPAARRHSI